MEAVVRRQRAGQPIPDRVRHLFTYMSTGGHRIDSPAAPLKQDRDDLIDTEIAATILGCSSRHVRRLAADLEGESLTGRWLFSRRTVEEYAEARSA
ncbi:helix-turn-helix domain-containing protein [Mycolicibacterium komossense]|uniref:Helix-turn-helix domain-containing protein n=1 Tax=Mycolicibacterium komossense TaxID=1779 RepID=A0ABT3CLK6_9MYCO|nr:helix-turn-helix domain-containing protein [Mycolicibacterium komossense]MCV7230423.1 helix-turn-helix domain-containing protein [Mycolicibacterium komossense]